MIYHSVFGGPNIWTGLLNPEGATSSMDGSGQNLLEGKLVWLDGDAFVDQSSGKILRI